MRASPRTEKLDLRLTSQAKQRIVAAAEIQGRTVSDFVLTSALERAEEVLTGKSSGKLNAEQWEKLQTLLDRFPEVAKS